MTHHRTPAAHPLSESVRKAYVKDLLSVWVVRSKIRKLLLQCYAEHHARAHMGFICSPVAKLWVPNDHVSRIDAEAAADFWSRLRAKHPQQADHLHAVTHATPIAHTSLPRSEQDLIESFEVKQTALWYECGSSIRVYPALTWAGLAVVQSNALHVLSSHSTEIQTKETTP